MEHRDRRRPLATARTVFFAALSILFLSASAIPQKSKPTTDEGILELMNLSPGMSAADVGAGRGDLALLMAERVGAEGRVYANEISKDLVEKMNRRIDSKGLRNITAVLGEEDDPRLPGPVDVIVLGFVYHHLSKPLEFMRNTLKYLKPSGRLFIAAEDIARVKETDPELKWKGNHDACISDPAATASAIEKAGYVLQKIEHLDDINRKIYVLALEPSRASQDIFEAVRSGKLESVKALVERDPRLVREKDGQEKSPLHWAVESDFLEIARYLLEKGAPVDDRDEKRQTPLHYVAVMRGSLEMAGLLLEKGADPSAEDILKTSVLMEAAKSDPKIADALLASGARIPPVGGEGQTSLLMSSARNGLSGLFNRLTSAKVDLFQVDRKGQTALHEAAAGGQIGIVDHLLRAGLKASEKNIYGWTPLHFAAERGPKEAVARLLEHGAEIDARTIDGSSAYDLAVGQNNDDVAALLSLKGADRSGPRFPILTGAYFGQKAPGKTAEQFAVGIVAARYRTHSPVVFTPDGREAYWTVLGYGKKRQRLILESSVENGRWTPPRPASFVRPGLEDDAPSISPDGRKFFFTSYRPVLPGGKIEKENIWVRERIDSGWSEPRPLPPVVNAVENIHQQVSADLEGNLYFSAEGRDSRGSLDIYVSKMESGAYQKPVNLGASVNSPDVEYTPFIDPDGSYLLFSRYNPTGWTLFVSFRTKDGAWTPARDLSGLIPVPFAMNLDGPSVTRDGKYLFFSGSFDGAIDENNKPFWVDASWIEKLRPKDK